jgi:hypothetical protein
LTFLFFSLSSCLSLHRINSNQSLFASRVVRPTAPRPIFRMENQSSPDRVRVHVLQFLPQLLFTPHVKVVKTSLPEMFLFCTSTSKPERQLTSQKFSPSPTKGSRNLLLQHLEDLGWVAPLRFADQQMHMLRHHHKPQEQEIPFSSHAVKDSDKAFPRPHRSKKRSPPVTTKGHKVEIALAVKPLQRVAHERQNPHPL